MESNKPRLAWAGMGDRSGWHRGVSWYPIEIVRETPKSYRAKAVVRMPLPSRSGRLRGAGIGDEFLVPKRAVSLTPPEELVRDARNHSPFVRPALLALLAGYESEMEELAQHESAWRWILEAAKQIASYDQERFAGVRAERERSLARLSRERVHDYELER